MFARIATFEGIDVEAAERVLPDVHPRLLSIVRGMPGWQGTLQLVDRSAGKVRTINLFDSEENMQAAESTFQEIPQRVPEVQQIAGGLSSVERYEVTGGVVRGEELV